MAWRCKARFWALLLTRMYAVAIVMDGTVHARALARTPMGMG
jgi:hypothetical protein